MLTDVQKLKDNEENEMVVINSSASMGCENSNASKNLLDTSSENDKSRSLSAS